MAVIDCVLWSGSQTQGLYAWKYPHSNLSTYTQLIVAESQEAVLFSKGQILGKFGPGKHTLHTENLPLLRNLFGLPFGGKNPFTAEVWFVNKVAPLNIDWETDTMRYHDPDYQSMVPLQAKGRYGLQVADAERFLVKLVGTLPQFGSPQLTDHFRGPLISKTKSVVMQHMQANRIGINSISANLDAISTYLHETMRAFWEDYGFLLAGFYLTSVDIDQSDELGRQVVKAMTQQSTQKIAGYTWQQQQGFEVAKGAVGQGGDMGLLGAVMMTGGMMGGGNVGAGLIQPHTMHGGAPGPAQPVQDPLASAPAAAVREVFCSNCGKKFSSAVKFCPHCGDAYHPCPKCGSDNDAKAARCVTCGTPLSAARSCSKCQSPLPPGGGFCPNCGQSAAAGGCSRCGAPLTPGVKFCAHCGQKAG